MFTERDGKSRPDNLTHIAYNWRRNNSLIAIAALGLTLTTLFCSREINAQTSTGISKEPDPVTTSLTTHQVFLPLVRYAVNPGELPDFVMTEVDFGQCSNGFILIGVANIGNAAGGPVIVRSRERSGNDDSFAYSTMVPSLKAGEEVRLESSLAYPMSSKPVHFIAEVDPNNAVQELDEGNNALISSYHCGPSLSQ